MSTNTPIPGLLNTKVGRSHQYTTLLPVNNINDVYYDKDKDIKLNEVLNEFVKGYHNNFTSLSDIYASSQETIADECTVKVDSPTTNAINSGYFFNLCTKITDNKSVYAYLNNIDPANRTATGEVRIVFTAGQNIIFGPKFIFSSNGATDISLHVINETRIVLTYFDMITGDEVVHLMQINGDVISNVKKVIIKTVQLGYTKHLVSSSISNNQIVLFEVYAGVVLAYIITATSSDLIISASSTIHTGSHAGFPASIVLSNDTVLIVYQDYLNNTYYGTARVVKITNNAISSVSNPYVFNTANTIYFSLVKLANNKALLTYGTAQYRFVTLTVSGTTITKSNEINVTDANITYIPMAIADSNNILFAYRSRDESMVYNTKIGLYRLTDGVPSIIMKRNLNMGNSDVQSMSVTKVANNKYLIFFKDLINDKSTYATLVSIQPTQYRRGEIFNIDGTHYELIDPYNANNANGYSEVDGLGNNSLQFDIVTYTNSDI